MNVWVVPEDSSDWSKSVDNYSWLLNSSHAYNFMDNFRQVEKIWFCMVCKGVNLLQPLIFIFSIFATKFGAPCCPNDRMQDFRALPR